MTSVALQPTVEQGQVSETTALGLSLSNTQACTLQMDFSMFQHVPGANGKNIQHLQFVSIRNPQVRTRKIRFAFSSGFKVSFSSALLSKRTRGASTASTTKGKFSSVAMALLSWYSIYCLDHEQSRNSRTQRVVCLCNLLHSVGFSFT